MTVFQHEDEDRKVDLKIYDSLSYEQMYLATLRCTYIYVIRANEFKTSTSLLSHVALHDTPATMGWSIIGTVRLKHMGTTLEHGVGSSSLLWNMQYEVPIHTVSALSSPSRSTE